MYPIEVLSKFSEYSWNIQHMLHVSDTLMRNYVSIYASRDLSETYYMIFISTKEWYKNSPSILCSFLPEWDKIAFWKLNLIALSKRKLRQRLFNKKVFLRETKLLPTMIFLQAVAKIYIVSNVRGLIRIFYESTQN